MTLWRGKASCVTDPLWGESIPVTGRLPKDQWCGISMFFVCLSVCLFLCFFVFLLLTSTGVWTISWVAVILDTVSFRWRRCSVINHMLKHYVVEPLICTDHPRPSWLLKMIWHQRGARASATTWLHCRYCVIWIMLRRKNRVTTIKLTMLVGGNEVRNPSIYLSLAGWSSHGYNASCRPIMGKQPHAISSSWRD